MIFEKFRVVQMVKKLPPFMKPATCYLLHAGFLLGLFIDLEDGGDMFL
jgi:hypothetical protein